MASTHISLLNIYKHAAFHTEKNKIYPTILGTWNNKRRCKMNGIPKEKHDHKIPWVKLETTQLASVVGMSLYPSFTEWAKKSF